MIDYLVIVMAVLSVASVIVSALSLDKADKAKADRDYMLAKLEAEREACARLTADLEIANARADGYASVCIQTREANIAMRAKLMAYDLEYGDMPY